LRVASGEWPVASCQFGVCCNYTFTPTDQLATSNQQPATRHSPLATCPQGLTRRPRMGILRLVAWGNPDNRLHGWALQQSGDAPLTSWRRWTILLLAPGDRRPGQASGRRGLQKLHLPPLTRSEEIEYHSPRPCRKGTRRTARRGCCPSATTSFFFP
jgi:hypothetical protein